MEKQIRHFSHFIIAFILLMTKALPTQASSFEYVQLKEGETKTIYLPYDVTSKNIYAYEWSNNSPSNVEIISQSKTSVTIKGIKYTGMTVLVQYDYYYTAANGMGNRESYDLMINMSETGPVAPDDDPDNYIIDYGCWGTITIKEGETKTVYSQYNIPSGYAGQVRSLVWTEYQSYGFSITSQGKYLDGSGYCTIKGNFQCSNQELWCLMKYGSTSYKAYYNVNVVKKQLVTNITLSESVITLTEGNSQWLYATVYPTNATNKDVTWSSSNTSVATVSASGKVEAVSAGKATITCKATDGSGVYATCNVTVKAKNVPPTGISISPSARQTMAINDEKRFSYILRPSNAVSSVTWSLSGDTDAATLSSSGWLTAKAEGTVCVKVTTANGYSDYCYVDIMPQPTAITVTPAEVEVVMGRTKQLSYSLAPDNAMAHSVTWASSDNSIAYVTSSGLVEARRPGTVTITATTDNGKVGKCTFTVPVPLFQLFVWMKNGEKTGYLSTDKPYFRLKGDVVKFTTDQLSFDIQKDELDKFTLEQVLPEHPLNILTADNLKVGLRKQKQLLYELIPADAQTKVTWLNSDTSVVSITDNGMVTGLKVGTAIVKAQTSNGLRASCKISVPEPAFRFYVWLKDGDVESYPLEERPLVELGPEIFTLTTHTTTVGYVAKDVLKFTLEDSAVRAVDGDINRDGQLTVDDITTLISIYLGELEAIKYDADLDGDHKVTVTDITKLIALYLKK